MQTMEKEKMLVVSPRLPKIPFGSSPIRFLRNQEQTWWVATDLLKACGYRGTSVSNCVNRCVKIHNRKYVYIDYNNNVPRTHVLNDAGVVELLTGLTKPMAASLFNWFLRNKTIAASYPETTIQDIIEEKPVKVNEAQLELKVPDVAPVPEKETTLQIDEDILPIFGWKDHNQLVPATILREFLEVRRDFSTWVKGRIEDCGAIEGKDYVKVPKLALGEVPHSGDPSLGGLSQATEYGLTIKLAEEFCLLERNEKGRKARKYLIEYRHRTQAGNNGQITTEAIISHLQSLETKNKSLENELSDLKEKTQKATTLLGKLTQVKELLLT